MDNPPTAKFCLNCGQSKDLEMALGLRMKAAEELIDLALAKMLRDPKLTRVLLKHVQPSDEDVEVPPTTPHS